MKIRGFHLLSILALAGMLAFSVGCPTDVVSMSTPTSTDGDPTATRPVCSVEVTTQGEGDVTIDCSEDGRFATLTAIAAEGWRFDRWIGVGSISNIATVAGDSNLPITAVFASLTDDTAGSPVPPGNANQNDNGSGDGVDTGNTNDNGNDNGNQNDNGNGNGNDNGAADADMVNLIVIGGTGGGQYERGELVSVVSACLSGAGLDKWVGDTEFIESGTGGSGCGPNSFNKCERIEVRVLADLALTSVCVPGQNLNVPTISIGIPDPQDPQFTHRTLFVGDSVNISVNAVITEPNPTVDRVVVFLVADAVFDPQALPLPNGDDILLVADTFSSMTSVPLSASLMGLQQDTIYHVGASIDDGIHQRAFIYEDTTIRLSTLPPVFWVGSIIDPPPGAETLDGMILEGVQAEDNAGTAFAGGADFTGDQIDDFFVLARYAKPEFVSSNGVGAGAAYMIAGNAVRRTGKFNLGSTGLPLLPGVVFTGVEPPPPPFTDSTEGLTELLIIPDADGDGINELAFGVPYVDSASKGDLDAAGQFRRGGVVIVSSKTGFAQPNLDGSFSLHHAGQRFQNMIVGPEPEIGPLCTSNDVAAGGWYVDLLSYEDGGLNSDGAADTCGECVGSILDPSTDGLPDTWVQPGFGFVEALAPAFDVLTSCDRPEGPCPSNQVEPADPDPPADPTGCPDVLVDGQILITSSCGCNASCAGALCSALESTFQRCCTGQQTQFTIGTGFYPDRIVDPTDPPNIIDNTPIGVLGARILGKTINDHFGSSMTLSGGDLIVSAPRRDGTGDETDGLPGGFAAGSGVAYLFRNDAYWEPNENCEPDPCLPPKPHQYMIDTQSHTLAGPPPNRPLRRSRIDALTIAGKPNQNIENILGIDDFNNDGRPDFAVGAPLADNPPTNSPSDTDGVVYIVYRQAAFDEGDFALERLSPSSGNPLDGALILGDTNSKFGFSLAGGLDFNGDGTSDLVVGAPGANGNVGEIVVIFGGTNFSTPPPINPGDPDGMTIANLLAQGLGARITGDPDQDFGGIDGGQFGFNVANAGDVDGDGRDDLLVAAPTSAPRFDPNPFDTNDAFGSGINDFGMDLNHDGVRDNVTGLAGVPDQVVDRLDQLGNAGLVYLILGSNTLSGTVSINELGKTTLKGAIFVGRRGDRTQFDGIPCSDPGNFCGDYLGGGDAGASSGPPNGGNLHKNGKGRSRGLAAIGDIDNDGKDDFAIGAILADPAVSASNSGRKNGGEAYIIYGFKP